MRLNLPRGTAALALTLGLAPALHACGSRSQLHSVDAGPQQPECDTDQDCDDGLFCTGQETCQAGLCVEGTPVACDDGNECTADACSETALACTHTALSRDVDGDGFNGPRAGSVAGAPGACGDDCDDSNPNVHPGATEVCNGIDDNCNGIVDDNAVFSPASADVAVSDLDTAPSGPGGLAWSGERFLASFWGYTMAKAHVYFSAFDRDGTRVSRQPQIQLTENQSDAYGAQVAWSGDKLGAVWQDRRTGDYEIWFALLDPDGDLLGPLQQITFATGFSINSGITWTGSEFVLVWQDERDAPGTGSYEIYAQRIDANGRQIGDNVRITRATGPSESPVIATSPTGLGITWLDGRDGPMGSPRDARGVWFATFDRTLHRLTDDTRLTTAGADVVSPTVVWNRDRWVIAWHDGADDSPDHEVWGAARDASNAQLVAPLRLTHDPNYSRYANLVPLGDRLMLTWADDRFNTQYEIMAEMIDANLAPLSPEVRVTNAPGASVYPIATQGPEGDIGILYQDQREGPWRVRFTRLECAIQR